MIQAEQQCRNEGARLLPVPRKTAGQQTAEHQLLTQRTDDAGTENDSRHRHLRKALVHHADRIASGQSVDHVVDIRADERTEPHQRTADDKPPAHALCACPLPAERHRRCFAPQTEHNRQRYRIMSDEQQQIIQRFRYAERQDPAIQPVQAELPEDRPQHDRQHGKSQLRAVAALLRDINLLHKSFLSGQKQRRSLCSAPIFV